MQSSTKILVLDLLTVYQDLTTRYDWLVEKAIVDLSIRIKKIFNTPPVIPLGCQNKDINAASQMLLTEIKLYL